VYFDGTNLMGFFQLRFSVVHCQNADQADNPSTTSSVHEHMSCTVLGPWLLLLRLQLFCGASARYVLTSHIVDACPCCGSAPL